VVDGFELFPDRSIVAMRVNGDLRDLATTVDDGDDVQPVAIDSADGLDILRHSAAHVLAQAVQTINPEAKLGIGPPITDGFYYDFDVAEPFTPENFKAIEKAMERIIRQGQRFTRRVVTEEEARAEMADEPYKLELIGLKGAPEDGAADESVEVGGPELTIYDNVDPKTGETLWKDLCRGPHLPSTRLVGNGFSITRLAAAYWRGSEKNKQLQRIYGTAWPSKDELRAYQARLEEAAKRDHRKLGKELDLFSFPEEIGSGLAVFHPKGGIIRAEIENYMRERLVANGYDLVNTPHITKGHLFETSQHLNWYREGMFPPMHLDEETDADGNITRQGQDYYLKPMNCPMHNLIFKARGRSYRELPLRLAEFGTVYRYEKSGTLSGLTRVRGLTQDDAHIYVTRSRPRSPASSSSSSRPCADTGSPISTSSCRRATPRSRSVPTPSGTKPPMYCVPSRWSRASTSSPTPAGQRSTGPRSRFRHATPSVARGSSPRCNSTSTSPNSSNSSTRQTMEPASGRS
jgi:threonyl-tRNA synthetase